MRLWKKLVHTGSQTQMGVNAAKAKQRAASLGICMAHLLLAMMLTPTVTLTLPHEHEPQRAVCLPPMLAQMQVQCLSHPSPRPARHHRLHQQCRAGAS